MCFQNGLFNKPACPSVDSSQKANAAPGAGNHLNTVSDYLLHANDIYRIFMGWFICDDISYIYAAILKVFVCKSYIWLKNCVHWIMCTCTNVLHWDCFICDNFLYVFIFIFNGKLLQLQCICRAQVMCL